MSYARILAHLSGIPTDESTMLCALSVANRFKCGVTILYIRLDPRIAATAGVGLGGGAVSPQAVESLEQEVTQRATLAKKTVEECVTRHSRRTGETGPRTSWKDVTGAVPQSIAKPAMLADLVLLAAPSAAKGEDLAGLAQVALLESGRPVLFIPKDCEAIVASEAVVAWDGSPHSARALFDALPLLKTANRVTVAQISAEGHDEELSSVVEMLGDHGISAHAETIEQPTSGISGALLDYVEKKRADLLVMGGYGKSPTREYIFGGATVDILYATKIPTLMAH